MFAAFFARFRRWRRVYRTFNGRCPYCGSMLIWQKTTGPLHILRKLCEDRHYALEFSKGRVCILSNDGDPIDDLFDPKFKLLKPDPGDDTTVTPLEPFDDDRMI